ncbi:hypothetical protein KHA80_10340 [Anaerobacillus sp. HL2]|nr:hypothetical protein KHA80_10340 [Anaerobacillus sp. HL2]
MIVEERKSISRMREAVEYITSVLIVAFCLYLVVTPLLKKREVSTAIELKDDTDEIQLKNIYATLNELEMDFHMQKLSEEDYKRSKAQYEKVAAEILEEEKEKEKKPVQNVQGLTDIEKEIEEELAKLRKERGEVK